MRQFILIACISLFTTSMSMATEGDDAKVELKRQIIQLAQSFEGQGDPDFSKQRLLEPLVQELLRISSSSPIRDRLPVLAGVWRQVWGPYDYRNDDRGIDPELGTEEIYQVVSSKGYYYNVSYLYKDGDRNQKRIGLLRGEYKVDANQLNTLNVKFTDYPGASSKPNELELWQLAEMAENDTLPNRITIVPSFIVRLFFGGGSLREVYTDHDLRITYGSSQRSPDRESIYIMIRMP